MLNTFVRLTLIVAAVLVAIAILHVFIPLLFKAAIIAAAIVGGLFLYNLLRRGQTPVIR